MPPDDPTSLQETSGASARNHDVPCVVDATPAPATAADGTAVEQLRATFLRNALNGGGTEHTEDALLVQTMLRAAALDYEDDENGAPSEPCSTPQAAHRHCAALRAVVDASEQAWIDSWVMGPTNVMDVVTAAIAATGRPCATIHEIWQVRGTTDLVYTVTIDLQVCRQWHQSMPGGGWPAPSPMVHPFLTRIGSAEGAAARSHIERVLRRSGGFVVLGYTHTNDVRWARRGPDMPGVASVQPNHQGKLPRDARVALMNAIQRADTGGDAMGDAYRAALLRRSVVARSALVGRLSTNDGQV